MSTIATVTDLLTTIRDRLDEPFDPDTNFWSNRELLQYLNEGVREVWQTARETHQNWFHRAIRSDQGAMAILGREYLPSALQLAQDKDEFLLPPDFFELRFFEPVPPSSTDADVIPVPTFTYKDMASEEFRRARRTRLSGQLAYEYLYDIEFRAAGPFMLIAPSIAIPSGSPHMTLRYVAKPPNFERASTLEGSGLNDFHLDAIMAYAVEQARRKEGDDGLLIQAADQNARKSALVGRASGPKQSRDPEVVIGVDEDDIEGDGGW